MTARDFLIDCLIQISVIADGETPSDSDIQLALRWMNRTIDSWNADRLKIWSITERRFNLTAGKYFYSIGDARGTPDFPAMRPTMIQNASIILAAVPLGLPLDLLTAREWAAIEEKGMLAHRPQKLYYDFGVGATNAGPGGVIYATGTIFLHPGPQDVGTMLDLFVWAQLSAIMTLDDVIGFPPGYEIALMNMISLRLAPAFQMQGDPLIAQNSVADMQTLEKLNASVLRAAAGEVTTLQAPEMGLPVASPPGAGPG